MATSTFIQRFAHFSEYTSFHGFRELAESRRWYQRSFWAVIMIGSVAMLGVAVEKQVAQYVNGSTTTRVARLTKDEPYIYPDVWVVFAQWAWLDAEKINRFGLTYEELQYAKSFYNPNMAIDSPTKSLREIEGQLNRSINRMNVSGLPELFSILALDTFDDRSNWSFQFQYASALGYMNYLLDLSEAETPAYGRTRRLELALNFSNYHENARKAFKFFHNRSTISDEKTNDDAFHEQSIGLRAEFFNFETNQYALLAPGEKLVITIDSKVYRHLRDCRSEREYDDLACQADCEVNTNHSFGQSCFEIGTLSERSSIVGSTMGLLGGKARICRTDISIAGILIEAEQPLWPDASKRHEREGAIDECKKSCQPRCAYASTTWSTQTNDLRAVLRYENGFSSATPETQVYQANGTSSVRNGTSSVINPTAEDRVDRAPLTKSVVEINFPDRSRLIVFEEVDRYDWNDMVSDLGGLLGLWLGASMMSLFQIVHLCCWTEAKSADLASPLHA